MHSYIALGLVRKLASVVGWYGASIFVCVEREHQLLQIDLELVKFRRRHLVFVLRQPPCVCFALFVDLISLAVLHS
jgi:hypothetical protein